MSGKAPAPVITGPADLRDKAWLEDQVDQLGMGIAAARQLWTNWSEGRHAGRLYPGMSVGEYIASRGLRLSLAEAMAALPDGSARQVGLVAGVSDRTVRRARGAANAAPATVPVELAGQNETAGDVSDSGEVPGQELPEPAPPAKVIGADGKHYPARVVRPAPKVGEVLEPVETEEVIAIVPVGGQAAIVRTGRKAKAEPAASPPESGQGAPDGAPVDLTGWKALELVLAALEELAGHDAVAIARAVPARRRSETVRRLQIAARGLESVASFMPSTLGWDQDGDRG